MILGRKENYRERFVLAAALSGEKARVDPREESCSTIGLISANSKAESSIFLAPITGHVAVEIPPGDNNSSPTVVPVIPWKCNYEARLKLVSVERNSTRENLSRDARRNYSGPLDRRDISKRTFLAQASAAFRHRPQLPSVFPQLVPVLFDPTLAYRVIFRHEFSMKSLFFLVYDAPVAFDNRSGIVKKIPSYIFL